MKKILILLISSFSLNSSIVFAAGGAIHCLMADQSAEISLIIGVPGQDDMVEVAYDQATVAYEKIISIEERESTLELGGKDYLTTFKVYETTDGTMIWLTSIIGQAFGHIEGELTDWNKVNLYACQTFENWDR